MPWLPSSFPRWDYAVAAVTSSFLWPTVVLIAVTLLFHWKDFASGHRRVLVVKKKNDNDKVLLIVDGCNGPIRLSRDIMALQNDPSAIAQSVSLLRVVNGENRQDRIHMVPALDRLVTTAKKWFSQAEIYFDGLGVDKYAKYGLVGQTLQLTDSVAIQVTPIHDEADNVIVQKVHDRQYNNADPNRYNHHRQYLDTQDTCDKLCMGEYSIVGDGALVFHRNSSGPGKSRQVVTRLGLLRPESVYCLFGFAGPRHVLRDARDLRKIHHLLTDTVVQQVGFPNGGDCISTSRDAQVPTTTTSRNTTIVVTDDIFLRQRIVQAGGLVMTFEQLWELLAPLAVEG